MPETRKSLMRSLGEFVGHVRQGLRAPVDPPATERVRRVTTDERVLDAGDERTIVARRTVIEEVEVRPSQGRPT